MQAYIYKQDQNYTRFTKENQSIEETVSELQNRPPVHS